VTEAELPKAIKGDAEAGKALDDSDGTPAAIEEAEPSTTSNVLGKFKQVKQGGGRGPCYW
jgi:hypothetical protein